MSKSEPPLDRPPLPERTAVADATAVDVPDDVARPSRWRRSRRFVIAALAVAVVVGPFTWWQIAARTDVLVTGYETYRGQATILTAGNATEYCYADIPGSTVVFGFSILNSGSHNVTVDSIDQWLLMADQSVTVDPALVGSDGPAASTQTLPVTIRPGGSRLIYLTLHLSRTIVNGGGANTFGDRLTLHVTTLGISRTEEFRFGDDDNPLWLGLGGVDDQGKYCDYVQPPLTGIP